MTTEIETTSFPPDVLNAAVFVVKSGDKAAKEKVAGAALRVADWFLELANNCKNAEVSGEGRKAIIPAFDEPVDALFAEVRRQAKLSKDAKITGTLAQYRSTCRSAIIQNKVSDSIKSMRKALSAERGQNEAAAIASMIRATLTWIKAERSLTARCKRGAEFGACLDAVVQRIESYHRERGLTFVDGKLVQRDMTVAPAPVGLDRSASLIPSAASESIAA